MNAQHVSAKGGCHCGAVRYELDGSVLRFSLCHCDDCRKVHGTPFSASIVMDKAGFRITAGESAMTAYESSPGKHRCFCSRCGSQIYAKMEKTPAVVVVRAGTLDGDPGIRPQMHIWCGAKAPWDEITDTLPQYDQGYVAK
jgi:hypothetical protein